jgi:Polysaccharide biosynthesis enzyme WcbI
MQEAARRVTVTSNCQTGGITAALQVLFPEDVITPQPLANLANVKAERELVRVLEKTDVWVSIGGYQLLEKYGLATKVRLVRIPMIRFSGFHPDLVYARRLSTDQWIQPYYNSAIGVWAYRNGLGAGDAVRLYNDRNFSRLGYLDHWGVSIQQLKERFDSSDLDFSEFILPMRREGLFMHSSNHPKVNALIRVARLAARKMGAGAEAMNRYIDINDGLNEVVWPIYPGVGDSLSLPSGYDWKMGEGRWVIGLQRFLEYTFRNFEEQGIAPNDLVAENVDGKKFDAVLGVSAKGGS